MAMTFSTAAPAPIKSWAAAEMTDSRAMTAPPTRFSAAMARINCSMSSRASTTSISKNWGHSMSYRIDVLERRLLLAATTDSSKPAGLIDVGGTVYFSADDGVHGPELWKSDGTAAGTVMVKDIVPGGVGSQPTSLIAVNGTVYFYVRDGFARCSLWKSDGTSTGTQHGKDLAALTRHSLTEMDDLLNVNGTLFFSGNTSMGYSALFKSDGTAGGTVIVKEFDVGGNFTQVKVLTAINSTIYLAINEPVHGRELWKSDGTSAGTVLVKDINPGAAGSNPAGFLDDVGVLNDVLYFSADSGNGTQLWTSDGTDAGTVMLKTINPSGDSEPSGFVNLNGALYFGAADDVHGQELWKTDGTTAGTVLVKE